jgi:uncharacterized protein
MRGRIAWRVLGAAGAGAGLVLLARKFEDRLIFWPFRRLRGSPADLGLQFETIRLMPAPGVTIYGWFVPHPAPRALVLYLEGNGGNRAFRLGHVGLWHQLGCSVLIIDYEGYGDSDGSPSEAAVYRDSRTAAAWIRTDPRTRHLPLLLHGESLGGAIAINLAAELPPAGLIVDHSFTTMADMANRVCLGLPAGRICRSQFRSIEVIHKYHGPLLVLHGDQDRFIPIAQGERLFAAANEPKRFVGIPGAGHHPDSILQAGGDFYRDALEDFLKSCTSTDSQGA